MTSLEGRFPFGASSSRCDPRRPEGPAAAFVLGVYPSALHVQWTHTNHRVAALAVAPEPWPFWDGRDEQERVVRWQQEVGWKQEWGRVRPAGRLNGSSGRAVADRVLGPLGMTLDQVWLTDALPFFHVHRGPGTQGAAMSERYDAFAREHGLREHQLPDRPTVEQLVSRAVAEEGDRLRQELRDAQSPLLITLGNEALRVAAQLIDGTLPTSLTAGDGYGKRHRAAVAGRTIEVLPLVHPGQRARTWTDAHERWAATVSRR